MDDKTDTVKIELSTLMVAELRIYFSRWKRICFLVIQDPYQLTYPTGVVRWVFPQVDVLYKCVLPGRSEERRVGKECSS